MVEMTVTEFAIAIVLQARRTRCTKDPVRSELPIGGRQPLECSGIEAPIMTGQLVETLIIQRSHHHSVYRFPVLSHGEGPLFLLSGCQSVAEGCPLQLQRLVGQGSANRLLVIIALAILHPGEGTKNTVTPLLLIF